MGGVDSLPKWPIWNVGITGCSLMCVAPCNILRAWEWHEFPGGETVKTF